VRDLDRVRKIRCTPAGTDGSEDYDLYGLMTTEDASKVLGVPIADLAEHLSDARVKVVDQDNLFPGRALDFVFILNGLLFFEFRRGGVQRARSRARIP
jgi:hypothetical protein